MSRLGTTIDDAAGEAFDKIAKAWGWATPAVRRWRSWPRPATDPLRPAARPSGPQGLRLLVLGPEDRRLASGAETCGDRSGPRRPGRRRPGRHRPPAVRTLRPGDARSMRRSTNTELRFVVAGGVAANKTVRAERLNPCRGTASPSSPRPGLLHRQRRDDRPGRGRATATGADLGHRYAAAGRAGRWTKPRALADPVHPAGRKGAKAYDAWNFDCGRDRRRRLGHRPGPGLRLGGLDTLLQAREPEVVESIRERDENEPSCRAWCWTTTSTSPPTWPIWAPAT
jgi:N6-L-threonylcarbamoyladenine synthase